MELTIGQDEYTILLSLMPHLTSEAVYEGGVLTAPDELVGEIDAMLPAVARIKERQASFKRFDLSADDVGTLAALVPSLSERALYVGEVLEVPNDLCPAVEDLLGQVEAVRQSRAQQRLVAYAAQKRWEMEQGGTVWKDIPIHTDDRSQGKYLSELQAITEGIREDGEPWKFADGVFRPLTNMELREIAITARTHIKISFAKEAEVIALIKAGAIKTEADIDATFAGL